MVSFTFTVFLATHRSFSLSPCQHVSNFHCLISNTQVILSLLGDTQVISIVSLATHSSLSPWQHTGHSDSLPINTKIILTVFSARRTSFPLSPRLQLDEHPVPGTKEGSEGQREGRPCPAARADREVPDELGHGQFDLQKPECLRHTHAGPAAEGDEAVWVSSLSPLRAEPVGEYGENNVSR